MTDLSNFLVLPQSCPCCQKPLKLFMQVLDGTLWQAQSGGLDQLIFEPYFTKDTKRSSQDYFQLTTTNNQYDFDFTTSSLYQHSKTWQLFFSVACEDHAIEKSSDTNYTINSYQICYYRSSPFLEFVDNGQKEWKLQPLMSEENPLTNNIRDEIFVFKDVKQDREHVYLFDIDYEGQQSILRYYFMTLEEKAQEYFEPKIFKKDLPLMNVRPDFANKNEMIDRFNGWINLS